MHARPESAAGWKQIGVVLNNVDIRSNGYYKLWPVWVLIPMFYDTKLWSQRMSRYYPQTKKRVTKNHREPSMVRMLEIGPRRMPGCGGSGLRWYGALVSQ